jgi:xylulokinase
MTAATVLGIDLGTSSVKVVLADPSGTILSRANVPYPVHRPQPDRAETDPADWWQAVCDAIGRLRAEPGWVPPSGIGLAGQMHGVVLCTESATAVRPALLWADARATAELEVYRALPDPVRTSLGNPLSPGMAGPQLAWLHRHEPESIDAARWALQPKDWIRARLTGHVAAEPSDASATLLYNVLTRSWEDELVTALRLRHDLLAEILPYAGVQAGELLPAVADELGLPAGIPVAAGAADAAAAALGTGLTNIGSAQLTIGTGIQIVTPVLPPSEQSILTAPITHLYRAATPDGWYALAASLNGGQTLEWVCQVLGASWADLYAAADRTPQPDDPIFLPHLVGERTPYLDSSLRGAWVGLAAGHDRTALLYAALEGVAFAAADALDALPHQPAADESLRLAGGGTVTPAWRNLLADALGVSLDAVEAPEASARGAALLAAEAAGLLQPDQSAELAPAHRVAEPGPRRESLQERRRRFHRVLDSLRPRQPAGSGGH